MTYLDEIISQFCRVSATHVIDLVKGDYSWMLEGMRTLSKSMGQACMKVSEILEGMHEDPRGTTVIVNGAEFLCADAHEYSSLLAGKLNELVASQNSGGVSLVLAGRDFDVSKLLIPGLEHAHRIQIAACDRPSSAQYLLGDLHGTVVPAGAATYEGPQGSPSVFFSPVLGPDGRSAGLGFLDVPLGLGGVSFSTAWAQNLVICGGSRSARSQLVAAMALTAQDAGALTWVATSAPDSAMSAHWRHHQGTMSTGVVQARELLRLVCDRVFPRIDACRRLGTKDVRDFRISADLARPIAVFIDDLHALTKGSATNPEVDESGKAVETLIGFLAKVASQTNVSLVVAAAGGGLAPSAHLGWLWNSAAQLQLGPSISDHSSVEAPLYFAAPGLPGVALQTARV
ncbi:hypothetical protein [Arthrobacter sp. MAHUQ-56]